jgi:hypothetical protein
VSIGFRDIPAEGDLDAARRKHEQFFRDAKVFHVVSSEMAKLVRKRDVARVVATLS